jgi:hypothetical protein
VGVVAEVLGRGLADVSFIGPILASELRRITGAPASAEVETVVLDAGLVSLASPAMDGTSTGVAVDVQGAARALLVTDGPDGLRVVQVPLARSITTVDLTRPSTVPEPSAVAMPVPGADRAISKAALARWTALGLAVACADLVGVMDGAVRLSADYATQRHQYGAAIGSFQAVQHLLADAHVLAEGARSVSLHALWAVDELAAEDALAAAAVAKAYCARAALRVGETAIQVHGGIGNTWECLAHVYLRRSLLSSDLLGGAEANVTRVLAHRGLGGGHGLR